MAPKRGVKVTKKAAGGKRATSTASVKQAGTRRAPARKAAATPAATAASSRPRRTLKSTQDPVDEGEDDARPPPAAKSRATGKRKAADADDGEDAAPPAPGRRPARSKREADEEEDDGEYGAKAKRPRQTRLKTKSLSSALADASTSDEEDQTKTTRNGKNKVATPEAPNESAEGEQDVPAEQQNAAVGEDGNNTQDVPAEQQDGDIAEDTAETAPDCELDDNDELARVESDDVPFRFRREETDVTLKARLQVYKHPAHGDCVLFYRFRIWTTREGETEGTEAGYIKTFRIARSNRAHRPRAENAAWIRILLPRNIKDVPEDLEEVSLCLRALFTLSGAVSASKIRDAAIRDSLADEALVFIEMVHVRRPFQRRGLLTPLLGQFQALLQRLPEWFAFAGNLVLVPGPPDNAIANASWGGLSDREIEDTLRREYENHGFVVWVRNAKVGDQRVTVMGRRLRTIVEEEEKEEEEEADD